jgi:tetratricopeptide (TPR) repeat protein
MKSCSLLLFSVLLLAASCRADEGHHHATGEKLGSVSFPTSCSPAVQKSFERGMALLYSFEYDDSENQFKEVAASDPQCAMAYWGQAMSLYHQLWSRPSKDDLRHGSQLLEKAQQLQPKTQRESDYIDALAGFYRDPDTKSHRDRVNAYSAAMEGVYKRYPGDREAAVFYALSLLSAGEERDPQLINPRKAVAILNRMYEQEPDHPGIAHYIIHACDNPSMASLGLPAARKYAAIAPSSAHAVHMPSHIFTRLGLWQDDIQSNLAALRVADAMPAPHVAHHKMHSMDFLEYAYLQIGDDEKARAEIEGLSKLDSKDLDADMRELLDEHQAGFPATYAIERRQWKDALAMQVKPGVPANTQWSVPWARAIAAGHLHDAAAGRDALQQYNALLEATRKGAKAYVADGLKEEQQVVEAWADYAQGHNDDALRLLRQVADKQDKVGKGETELPAREMLADMLLEMNRPEPALKEYQISLKTNPNRFNGLYGAAQAAELAQQKQAAAGYYAQLLKNCDGIQSDRPELARARELMTVKTASRD